MPISQPTARRPAGGGNLCNSPQALEMPPGKVHTGPEASWRAGHVAGQEKEDGG